MQCFLVGLKARVYTENTSDAWHIPRYPTRKHCITSIYIADEVRSSESAIINLYPTSVSRIIVLLKNKHWIKYFEFCFLLTRVFGHFKGKFSVTRREPIRLPEIQYLVFGI